MLELKTLQDLNKYLSEATGAHISCSQVSNGEIMISFGYVIPYIALVSQRDSQKAVVDAYQKLVEAIHDKRLDRAVAENNRLNIKLKEQDVIIQRYKDALALQRGEELK